MSRDHSSNQRPLSIRHALVGPGAMERMAIRVSAAILGNGCELPECSFKPRVPQSSMHPPARSGAPAALRSQQDEVSESQAQSNTEQSGSESAAAENVVEDGGDSGSSEDGEGDDGEPPILVAGDLQPEWWQVSLILAAIVSAAVLAIMLVLWKPNRFFIPILISSFLGSFATCLYFDPRYWYRRMSEACLASLFACNFFAGFSLSIPFGSSTDSLVIQLPESHWSMNIGLAALAALFAVMHSRRNQKRG